MNTIFKYKSPFCLLAAVLIIDSCTKFVQIPPPGTQLVTASVFSNNGSANSALTAIYTQMAQNAESYYLSQNSALLADEMIAVSTRQDVNMFYENAMLSTSGFLRWGLYYNYIYQANAVIEGLENNKGTDQLVATELTAEAKFIRAWWYFYLVNCYGPVPLATTTDYTINRLLPRSSVADVYRQIITDLQDAKSSLYDHFVDATDTAETTERVRPTKAAASALLARVYLYTGKYDSAGIEASNVLADSKFALDQDLTTVFLANSTEAIWQLQVPQPANGQQTPDAYNYVIITAPIGGAALSSWLMRDFEPGDKRKTSWVGFYLDGVDSLYFPYKYQVYADDAVNNPTGRSEYTMLLRLAEQYLIRAEARVQLGNTLGALDDLDSIRRRAGLGDYTGGTDRSSLLAAILHERRVELFTEWGHRWFDLIRTNNINQVMGSPGNITQQKGGTWTPQSALYPIPYLEIKDDPDLTQNPGY